MSVIVKIMKEANFIEKPSVFLSLKKDHFLNHFFRFFKQFLEFFISKNALIFFDIYSFVELDEVYQMM
jgi:hypothetical protein